MASTDIDGTPILILTALEAEYMVEILSGINSWDDWGSTTTDNIPNTPNSK